jgi:hypothetical protein
MLLNWVQGVLRQLPSLDAKTQAGFWQGSMPAQFLNEFPWLAKFTPAQVVEYCQVRQSVDQAHTRLIIRACGDRENPKGKEICHQRGCEIQVHRYGGNVRVNPESGDAK